MDFNYFLKLEGKDGAVAGATQRGEAGVPLTQAGGRWNGSAVGRPAERATVTAQLQHPKCRMRCLSVVFGARIFTVENTVYQTMARLCPYYRGGAWDVYLLSNGGVYLAASAYPEWLLISEVKDVQMEFDAGPAGMLVTAMALTQLSFARDGELMTEMHDRLRAYIKQQPDAERMVALLD